jgi:hypothetical protein
LLDGAAPERFQSWWDLASPDVFSPPIAPITR